MKHLFIQFVVIAILFMCSGCASMLRIDGPYEGKIIDAETKQPIEGAVIHGTWYKVHLGGAHEYYDSYEILTDKNGNFKIPGKGLLVLSDVEEIILNIFKVGYSQVTPNPWSGLKVVWPNNEITWKGNVGIFKINKMTIEERQKRGVILPDTPHYKQRDFIVERNKEMIEIGRPASAQLPVE